MNLHLTAYDIAYSDLGQKLLKKVGEEVYGEYIGQLSWMTTEEYRRFIARLAPGPDSHVLEIGSGNGGAAVYLANSTGARVTGLDSSEPGLQLAAELARSRGLAERVDFRQGDATRPLPFPDNSFDAIFSNDTFSLIPERLNLFRQCHRVLRTGGRLLFTDPMVLTGIVCSEEVALRTWAGAACLVPPGENERLLHLAGFDLLSYEDLTESVIVVARRQAAAYERFRAELIENMGAELCQGLIDSTSISEKLADQKRLIRIAYLARKAASR